MASGPVSTPSLRIQRNGSAERLVEISRDRCLIGRSDDCDVVLDEPTVSSRHARVVRKADGWYIEDLESRNNTYLENRPIKGKGPVRLDDGQAFRICDFWFVFNGTRVWIEDKEPSSSSIRASVEVNSDDADRAVNRPAEVLQGILALIRAVGPTLEIDVVLEKVLDALMIVFPQADRGFVYLDEDGRTGRTLTPRRHRQRRYTGTPYTISRTIVEEVLDRAVALCCEDLPGDEKLGQIESLAGSGIRTMICAPILGNEQRPIGMIQLDAEDLRRPFGPEDLELMLALLGPIGVAVENARLHEEGIRRRQRDRDLKHAREVQRALLPEEPPRPPGYTFWHYYESAYDVGGDYFGYLPPGPSLEGRPSSGRWAITVGDVAGKGMPAALLMAKLSSEAQLALAAEPDPQRVLDRLNRRIGEADLPDSFITFMLMMLDIQGHRLSVVSAGHHNPILRRADGEVVPIMELPQGPPLGIFEDVPFVPVEVTLEPGDVVVLYTDGVPDATDRDGSMFGNAGLLRAIAAGPGRPETLGPSLLAAIDRHVGAAPPADDITLICFGRDP